MVQSASAFPFDRPAATGAADGLSSRAECNRKNGFFVAGLAFGRLGLSIFWGAVLVAPPSSEVEDWSTAET